MFNPCCCTTSCLHFSDDFNRADSTALGADWTETAGNWEILSNELKITTSNAICKLNVSVTADYSFEIAFRAVNSGDKVCFYSSYSGTGSYKYEFEVGATAKLRIYVTDTFYGYVNLQLVECPVTCPANTMCTFKIVGYQATRVLLDGLVLSSLVNGFQDMKIGTGTITGNVYFDNAITYYSDNGSTHTPCNTNNAFVWFFGDNGATTSPVTLTITGATGADAGLNGTYSLTGSGGSYGITGLSISTSGGTLTTFTLAINSSGPLAQFTISSDVSVSYYRLMDGSTPTDFVGQSLAIAGGGTIGTATISY